MRTKPGVSPDSWLGALSRDAPSFVAISLAALGQPRAHSQALLHACQVMLDRPEQRMVSWLCSSRARCGGQCSQWSEHGLWGQVDLATC